jgi:LmbE family N-acetylglucosaminyl deacetylase
MAKSGSVRSSIDIMRREFIMAKIARRVFLCLASAVLAPSLRAEEAPAVKPGGAKKLTVLAVGAHMDDAEIGIGGILLKAVRAGHRVVVVVTVSDYRTWELTLGREEQCKKDQLALAKRIGYEKRFLDYPYHQIPADNEAKRKIAEIYVELQPDVAFVHNVDDHWPDHANSGSAAKDAVLFSHGYTQDRRIRRCPRVLAFSAVPEQTIRFEPDLFVDVTPVMAEYMDLLAETDSLLSGRPVREQFRFEVRNLKSNEILKLSGHGWPRYCQCVGWAGQSGAGMTYAIGLKTLWGPRDGRPLW